MASTNFAGLTAMFAFHLPVGIILYLTSCSDQAGDDTISNQRFDQPEHAAEDDLNADWRVPCNVIRHSWNRSDATEGPGG